MLNAWQLFLCCTTSKPKVVIPKIRIETKVSTQVESDNSINAAPSRPPTPALQLRLEVD